MRLAQNGQGIVLHPPPRGYRLGRAADANDLAVEGHLIVVLAMWFSLCFADRRNAGLEFDCEKKIVSQADKCRRLGLGLADEIVPHRSESIRLQSLIARVKVLDLD
jgi:hypothetical protein